MPKNPADLPRLVPTTDPADRVRVQQTAFSHDVLGRFVCNDWDEVSASLSDGAFSFDVIVIGAGMFGGYCAEKLYRLGAASGLRILVLDAGAMLLPVHIQNLPQRLGGSLGGPRYNRTREDGTGVQNVVWGIPWISNEPFPGLAYCLGGRSIFWGGWSPRLTKTDLDQWPADVTGYLTGPGGYDRAEIEIGTVPTADYMLATNFHDDLRAAFVTSVGNVGNLDAVEEAPLAVVGTPPASGLFAYDKFSSAPFLIDAVRSDAADNSSQGDVSRRLFVVPRARVLRLNHNGGTVTSLDVAIEGRPQPVPVPVPPGSAVVIANGTIEATRLALDSLGVGDRTANPASPRLGNLMAHLRSNITVRIRRAALGLPAGPPADLETTAFLVRGQGSGGRQFHIQVSAAAVGGIDPERNMWQQVPDIDTLAQIRANQDPDWITIVLRCIGETEGDQSSPADPAKSWIDLSSETDEHQQRRAYVHLAATAADEVLWQEMDKAAFDLAADLAGPPPPVGQPATLQYLQSRTGPFDTPRPQPAVNGRSWWQDGLGTTHHEAGTLFMGAAGQSVTDTQGRFHGLTNAYVVGPAIFPMLGSANPSLAALALAQRTAELLVKDRTGNPPKDFVPLSRDPADWTLVGRPGTNPAMSRLGSLLETGSGYGLYYYIKEQFEDASFWIEWRELAAGDNSGVYVRTPGPGVANPLDEADAQGHEVQIDDLAAGTPAGQGIHGTGAIYGLQAPTGSAANLPGQWNTYLIETAGSKIKVTLNGKPINDYTSTRRKSGFLALQVHGRPSRVQFRNLHVKR
ncbi:MAG TPA: family 16 glycoside hydrolase [Blastococcus sp.]|nr:family 16 glycoside hydrolase [Blastococcus sp.]